TAAWGDHNVYLAATGERARWSPPGSAPGRGGTLDRNLAVLAALAGTMPLYRALAGDRVPLGHGAQAYDVHAHWGHCRVAHLQSPGGTRRRAQLGLPLHLDPGCGFHAVCVYAARLQIRGRAVHGVVGATYARGGASWTAAAHVRH